MNRAAALLLLPMAAAAASGPAHAGQVTAAMPVTLVVEPGCQVSATPMAFAGRPGNAIDAESRIAVACNGDVPLLVTLDAGSHAEGGQRRLAGEGGYVAYALYSDSARVTPWTAGMPLATATRGGQVELAAYGRIGAGETLGAGGAYADTIAITIDF
ncbi:Csu type fimbrial protein [Tsuneonella sp. SYSU-LHT278]|uniref:Csu type fimbrial protein n=1 Tax=Tsuneonella sediminis TaxID=3416089 RepID=UPI003F7AFE82